MNFSIDIVIVISFLIINLGVGLYYGRGVKTVEDYATGGRNFSTAALVSTIVATTVTGSLFMICVSRTYESGLYGFIPILGLSFSLLFLAYFVIPKMKSFFGNISMAEAMGKHYGEKVRVITALCAIVANVGAIAVQYKVFGGIIHYFVDISIFNAVLITGLVITIYSAFGGVRSVTFTDILQFMIFGTVIPLIGIILWKNIVGSNDFVSFKLYQNNNYNLKHVLNYNMPGFWPMLFLLFYSIVPSSISFFQRIIMGNSIKQVKKAFKISALVMFVLILSIVWIGFLLFNLNSGLSNSSLIPYIVDNYSYAGLKGVIVVGIMAMVMSSADSFVNIASVLIVHDILQPYGAKELSKLKVVRAVALVVGICPIFLALSGKDLLDIILFANAFYLPIVAAPLLLTLIGFRTTSKSVLSGMAGGFITVIIWKISAIDFDPIIPAMLVNLIIMMSVHYIGRQDGGWVEIEMEKSEENEPDGVFFSIYKSVRYFNYIDFVYQNSPRDEGIYSFFGIFCFISTITTIYLTQMEMIGEHGDLVTYLYMGMLLISSFFGLHMMWSDRIRNPILVSTVWHFALIYSMTFCTTFFLFLSKFHHVQIMVLTLNLMVIFNLCRWKTSLTVMLIGMGASVVAYQNLIGEIPSSDLITTYNMLIYLALMSCASLFAFSKPKQEYIEHKEEQINVLKADSEEKDQKLRYFKRAMQENGRRIDSFLEKIAQRNYEIEKTKIALEGNKAEIIKLEKSVATKERQYQELNNSSKYNMENARITQYSIEDMRSKLNDLKENVALKEHHVKELKNDIQQSHSSIDELNLEIKRGARQVSTLKKQIQNREKKIAELTAQIKMKDSDMVNLSERAVFFEEKYIVQEKEIERLNETANRILNNVTHELRLPVGNVMNFAEMLSEQVEGMKDNHIKMLSDEVFQNSTRLSTMILNMLDLMTLNTKKVELDKQTMNIGEIIKERTDRCKKIYLDGKPIKFKMQIESDMLAPVDVHYMKQVIDNLIINAIKFSEHGAIIVSAHKITDHILINISDEGKGIPSLEMYDIFTPFIMASNSASKAEGRGVGLTLCKAAIEAHGGNIEVRSDNEIGAQFTIKLPI
ncbi:MAG: hypothetical protein DGJ47_000756 [Rickettsiaceae bacterium]